MKKYIIPTLSSWKSLIFNILVCLLFLQIIFINPHHKVVMVPHASIISEKVSITVLCLICTPRYTAVWNKNCSKRTSVIKVVTIKNTNGTKRPSYCLKQKVSIALLCQLCSTSYTAVQIKNCLKSTSVIKVDTMKNTDDFHYAKGAITCNHQINCFLLSAKMNGTQRRTLVSPWMYCMYCGMPKGTSWPGVTSNSEKIKPIGMVIIELC